MPGKMVRASRVEMAMLVIIFRIFYADLFPIALYT